MNNSDRIAIPVVEEDVSIEKRLVETGHVRVNTSIDEVHEVLRDTLRRGVVDVARRPVGAFVANTPSVREEGDVLIIPVLEERAVVEKRLFLVEEIHVRRSTETVPVELPTTRRVTRVEVEDTTDQQQQGKTLW